MTKERLYMLITLIATYLQASVVPGLKLGDDWSFMLTTILLAVASIFTLKKQRISVEVNSKAKIFTWVLIVIAAFGCINEIVASQHFVNVFKFSEDTTTTLRTSIAALIGLLNVFSKVLFPTDEAKVINEKRADLKQIQKFK